MSLTYTTGNPANLVGGTTAAMSDISGPFADIKTFLTDGAASIGTTLLANNAVTAAKIESQQAWQTIAISGTGLTGTLSYFKDSLGMVHVRGDTFTTSASIPDGTTIGTFPAGARPGVVTQLFPMAYGTTGATGACSITTAGVLAIVHGFSAIGASATLSFGGVHFRAEN